MIKSLKTLDTSIINMNHNLSPPLLNQLIVIYSDMLLYLTYIYIYTQTVGSEYKDMEFPDPLYTLGTYLENVLDSV